MGRHRTSRSRCRVAVAEGVLSLALWGCYRTSPPDVPEFRVPPRKTAQTPAPAQPVEPAPPAAAPEIRGPLEPPPEATPPPPPPPPAPPPAAPPKPEAPAQPTLIGTWRVTQMSHGEQPEELPEGMQMTMTFAEGGALVMSISGGPVPEAQTTQGTYTLNGSQITMTMEGDSKSGVCTFVGNDQVTIEIDGGRLVLRRS